MVKLESKGCICSDCGVELGSPAEAEKHRCPELCPSPMDSAISPKSHSSEASVPKEPPMTNGLAAPTLRCALCTMALPDIGALQLHTLQAHSVQDIQNAKSPFVNGHAEDEKVYSCDVCSRSFESILALHNHQRTGCSNGGSPRTITCPTCQAEIKPGTTLKEHEDENHPKRICPVCSEAFADFALLESHAMQEHFFDRRLRFVCRACGKSYDCSDDLQRHLFDIHALQIFKCALCDQMFDSSVDVQMHLSVTHSHQVEHFPCKSCNDATFVFETEDNLRLHVTLFHLGAQTESPWRASLQDSFAPRPKTSDVIVWTDAKDANGCRAFACKLCPESFDVEFLYERHMESVHAAQLFQQYSSPDWVLSGKRARLTEKHVLLGQQQEPVKCSICDRLCESSCELAEHRLSHCRVTKSDTCAVCRKSLLSLEDYFIHSHEHNGQGNGQACIICKQSLASAVELHFHGKFHLNQPSPSTTPATVVKTENPAIPSPDRGGLPFQCIKCHACFSSEPEIRAHVATHMLTEGVNHHCRLCCQVFDSPSKLQCHLIDHSFPGRSEYECCICGSVFTRPQGLQQHIFMHPFEERPYSCSLDDCGQRFFFRSELDNHELSEHHAPRVELKAKTFTCGNCDKRFPSLELVAVHRRFCGESGSSGQKPFDLSTKPENPTAFPCTQCSKSFSSLSALQGHSHVHTSGKGVTHQCTKCDRTFSSATKLRNHQRAHNRDLGDRNSNYTCAACGQTFTRKDIFKSHLKSHGRDSPRTPDGIFANGLPTLVPRRDNHRSSPKVLCSNSPSSSNGDDS